MAEELYPHENLIKEALEFGELLKKVFKEWQANQEVSPQETQQVEEQQQEVTDSIQQANESTLDPEMNNLFDQLQGLVDNLAIEYDNMTKEEEEPNPDAMEKLLDELDDFAQELQQYFSQQEVVALQTETVESDANMELSTPSDTQTLSMEETIDEYDKLLADQAQKNAPSPSPAEQLDVDDVAKPNV